jgi:hypothetical protein
MNNNKAVLSGFTTSLFNSGKSTTEVRTELRKYEFHEVDIENAIAAHMKLISDSQNESVLLDPEMKSKDWYTGPNTSVKSHWAKLTSVLITEKAWDRAMVNDLDGSSNVVVSKLANPKLLTGENTSRGLVLGYVQSGKTANYSAVISKALDAGYKFIIVLSGVHNNLRYQTEVRLRKEIIDPSEIDADTITRMDPNGDFDGKIAQSANKVLGHEHGFGIAVIKKNSSVLRKFNSWLNEARKEILEACPVLIIDDECDQASINTHQKPEEKATVINKQIRTILNHFQISSYVGYTATPYANIFIDPTIEDDLYPKDFIIALKKPVSYIGSEDLFGTQDDDGNITEGLPVIRSINVLDNLDNYEDQDENPDELPNSLKNALASFLISGAIRLSRGHFGKHISMLIHCSHLKDDHRSIFNNVRSYVQELKTELNFNNDSIAPLYELFNSDFVQTSKTIDNIQDKISIQDFTSLIKNFIGSLQVILDNSESTERLSFQENFWGIVIGGNTLSRGLTIEGLCTSYFMRSSKQLDTLMQMGRWFGYRPGYKDLQRIFITNEIRDRFLEMSITETELREEIETMAHNDESPLDFKIKIRQHAGTTLTAKNKMRTAQADMLSFSGRRGLPDFLNIHDDKISLNNLKATSELLQSIKKLKLLDSPKKFSMFRTSYTYLGCPKELILQFLDDYFISSANSRANKRDLISYITETKELTNWSVAVFSLIKGNDSYKFDSGEEVVLLDRSYAEGFVKPEDKNSFYIRGLYLPKDEMIDLADLYNTNDVIAALKGNGEKELGCAKVRTSIRPKDRPLLAIYPLSQNSKSEERDSGPYKMKPIKSKHVQIGIMIVFPENKRFIGGAYMANSKLR